MPVFGARLPVLALQVAVALATLATAGCTSSEPGCLISADCAALSRCVDGACQPPAACRVDIDCPAPPSCASVSCTSGTCTTVGDDAACGPGAICDIGRGCIRPPAEDAGTRDACMPADERCDGDDQDCDGRVDEGGGLCFLPRAEGTCADGQCEVATCAPGFADCNARADDGCEASLGAPGSCGACGVRCEGATPLCATVGGETSCVDMCPPDAATDCSGACVDTTSSILHCGGCNAACEPAHATGVCTAGACTVSACEPGWGDCDASVATGCETSLATTTHCGGCGVACNTPSNVCEVLPATCVGGACLYTPAVGATVCRPAADACDVAETCGGATGCPADTLTPVGSVCRAASCGTDPAEECTGSAASCPAACGCHGEPCCSADACASGLACRAGTCRSCMSSAPAVSGAFNTAVDCSDGCYYAVVRSVSASGTTITFTDSLGGTGSLTLGGGVTASGSFTATVDCSDGCYYGSVRSITASGSALTFRDSLGGVGSITFSGATVAGSYSTTVDCSDGCYYHEIRSVAGSGASMTFTDSAGAPGTFTLSAAEICS